MNNNEVIAEVAKHLESLERVWQLVEGAESEGQGFVPASAIRAAIQGEGT